MKGTETFSAEGAKENAPIPARVITKVPSLPVLCIYPYIPHHRED